MTTRDAPWSRTARASPSGTDPAVISTQDWHLLHGSAESRARPVQLSAFASSRAADVFPVPRLPLNR